MPHRRDHALLHPQRRITRAHSVIFARERRAEERHDPVAHHLVDGPLVAVHGLHHVIEHGVEEPARLLGAAVGEEFHGALEVREEHRHLLALPFERRLRVEDPLGEVFRSVRVGGRRAGLRGSTRADRLTALLAELRASREFRRARLADDGQPPTTLHAELGVPGVLVPTLGATHHVARITGTKGILRAMGPP